MELWHYTSVERCQSILKGQELWMSRYLDTNDAKDCALAKELLSDYFKGSLLESFKEKVRATDAYNKIRRSGRIDINSPTFYKHEISIVIEPLFDAFLNRHNPTAFDGYMFCFSQRDDRNGDDGILSMWRGYGDKQPVALVFNKDNLMQSIQHLYPKEKSFRWKMEEIEYSDKGEKLERRFSNQIKILKNYILGDYFDVYLKGGDVTENLDALGSILESIWDMSFAIKHPGFYEEKEVRLFIGCGNPDAINISEEFKQTQRHYPFEFDDKGKRRIKIHLGDDFKNCLTKIVIGPENNPSKKSEIKKLIRQQVESVPIMESSIPFLDRNLDCVPYT